MQNLSSFRLFNEKRLTSISTTWKPSLVHIRPNASKGTLNQLNLVSVRNSSGKIYSGRKNLKDVPQSITPRMGNVVTTDQVSNDILPTASTEGKILRIIEQKKEEEGSKLRSVLGDLIRTTKEKEKMQREREIATTGRRKEAMNPVALPESESGGDIGNFRRVVVADPTTTFPELLPTPPAVNDLPEISPESPLEASSPRSTVVEDDISTISDSIRFSRIPSSSSSSSSSSFNASYRYGTPNRRETKLQDSLDPFKKKFKTKEETENMYRRINEQKMKKGRKKGKDERYDNRIKEMKEGPLKIIEMAEGLSIKGAASNTQIKPTDIAKEFIRINEVPDTADTPIHSDLMDLILLNWNIICTREESNRIGELEESEEELRLRREKWPSRPPIVAIMGHINHGKTSLLDSLRNSHLVDKEAGKITQLTAGFSVKTPSGAQITFVDTPGHEAFNTMRSKTAKIVDAIILVVAGDEGVKEQTVEAIQYIQEANKPLIIAVNKKDKPNYNADNIRKQLFQHDIITTQDGGDVEMVEISALQRTGLDDLENTILYIAESLGLKDDPASIPQGIVVESRFSKGKGSLAQIIMEKGTLKIGHHFVSGLAYGKVKNMYDDLGNQIMEAPFSSPVSVMGMRELVNQGDDFLVVENEYKAKETVYFRKKKREKELLTEQAELLKVKELEQKVGVTLVGPTREILLVMKAGSANALQALCDSVQAIPQTKVNLRIVSVGVGPITQADMNFADTSKAVLVSYGCLISPRLIQTAKEQETKLFHNNVIYSLLHEIKEEMIGKLEPIVTYIVEAEALVKERFEVGNKKDSLVVGGCKVITGTMIKKMPVQVKRGEDIIFRGRIGTFRHHKDAVTEIQSGKECGISVDRFTDLQVGDIIQSYTTKISKPHLE